MAGTVPEQGGSSAPSARPLSGARSTLLSEPFHAATATRLRHTVAGIAEQAGLTGDDLDDFVLATYELITNAVRHGGGRGRLTLHQHADVLTCEVSDDGPGADSLPVQLPPADTPGGRGLWLAHQLSGSLALTSAPDGVTASITVRLTAPPAGAPSPTPGPEMSEDRG